MINEHEMAVHNPRIGFSINYNPFTQCERIFKKNYRLSKDLVRQFMVNSWLPNNLLIHQVGLYQLTTLQR